MYFRCIHVKDFMGGSCHRGLRQGAEMLLADAKEDVLDQLSQHKGYRLVVTGHSLGGGKPRRFLFEANTAAVESNCEWPVYVLLCEVRCEATALVLVELPPSHPASLALVVCLVASCREKAIE